MLLRGKDINIFGGQINIVSKTNGNAFSVTTNQGISETIVLTNTQGNSQSAIKLAARLVLVVLILILAKILH